ncbi:type II toxin-antitoxin system RelB/DinJ family antitoxin [Levilactobacillus tujiorum]|uniref:type II toxin-antitoxin system RelB/DinJ family antitoxin n=1 Tax=Levilactobacillus tujiorum TaxID=2912243 RepID=UPI00145685D9|nr:type II toxin-antitoxin system RelB/DinJ family antitoxin [Levilactobacillus tujiorum]NLR31506.1 type II toxin-antitoxin system RelB/DinJ family antitoxin [Levilactobacillus tujiorum]
MDNSKEHTPKTQRLNIRVDGELKDEAQAIYQQLGLDMSTAITLFLKQSVADKGLPFRPNLKDSDSCTPAQVHALIQSGKLKHYTNIDDLWKDLNE